MPDNKLELIVEVDGDRANASMKGINGGLSSFEQKPNQARAEPRRGDDVVNQRLGHHQASRDFVNKMIGAQLVHGGQEAISVCSPARPAKNTSRNSELGT